jgi:hypothetical protein
VVPIQVAIRLVPAKLPHSRVGFVRCSLCRSAEFSSGSGSSPPRSAGRAGRMSRDSMTTPSHPLLAWLFLGIPSNWRAACQGRQSRAAEREPCVPKLNFPSPQVEAASGNVPLPGTETTEPAFLDRPRLAGPGAGAARRRPNIASPIDPLWDRAGSARSGRSRRRWSRLTPHLNRDYYDLRAPVPADPPPTCEQALEARLRSILALRPRGTSRETQSSPSEEPSPAPICD